MPDTTARLAIPQPLADRSDPYTVAEDIRAVAARLDVVAAMAEQGTLGARPAAGTARRLYFATDEGALYYDSGLAWALLAYPRPSVGVYRNAPMDIGGAFATVFWDGERWERNTPADSMHSVAVNSHFLTCPVDGVYLATVSINQAIVAAGPRATICALVLNGAIVGRAENNADGSAPNGPYAVQASAVRACAAGDKWHVAVAGTSPGGPWALSTGPGGTNPPGGDAPTEASLTLLTR